MQQRQTDGWVHPAILQRNQMQSPSVAEFDRLVANLPQCEAVQTCRALHELLPAGMYIGSDRPVRLVRVELDPDISRSRVHVSELDDASAVRSYPLEEFIRDFKYRGVDFES